MKSNLNIDFIIIGAQKNGTTSLSNYLSKHPEVCFCLEKEPDYFSKDPDWRNHLHKYHKLFKPEPGQILGEGSTTYTMRPEFEETAKRIHAYNPQMKHIYITRDPIERIISNYAHRLVRKRTHKDLQTEIQNYESYTMRSKYYYQISPFIELFGKDRILLLLFEDLISRPQNTLVEIAHFLGIDTEPFLEKSQYKPTNQSANRNVLSEKGISGLFVPIKSMRRYIPESLIALSLRIIGNKLPEKPEFPLGLKQKLYLEIKEDIQKFEKLFGREITAWKKY